KTAVTVSIIFKLPSQRVRQNDCGLAQSKRFKDRQRDGGTVRFCRNTLSRSGTTKPVFQRENTQPLIYHATAVPISAAFALRYRHYPMRRWVASALLLQTARNRASSRVEW